MVARYNTFPNFSEWNRFPKNPLQAPGFTRVDKDGVEEIYSGALNYLEFVQIVKKMWEEVHPEIIMIPYNPNRDMSISFDEVITKIVSSNPPSSRLPHYPPIVIGYALELRKPHTMDPKPRMRHQLKEYSASESVTFYGQKFQNIVSFTGMVEVGTFFGENNDQTYDDVDASIVADQIMDAFEDFMVEHTPILKAAGASDLVYARRVSDSELNKDGKDVLQRQVMYMLTTEKTYAISNARIQKIAVDARAWLKDIYAATPSYQVDEVGSEEVIRDSDQYVKVDKMDSDGFPVYQTITDSELIIRDHFQMATPDI